MKLSHINSCSACNQFKLPACCVKMNKIAKFGISILLGSAAGATLASIGLSFAASIVVGIAVTAITAVALVRLSVTPQKPQPQPMPQPQPVAEPKQESEPKPIAATSSSAPVEKEPFKFTEANAKGLLCKMSLPTVGPKSNVLCVSLLDTIRECLPNWSTSIERQTLFFTDQTTTDALINTIYRTQISEKIDFRDGTVLTVLEKLFGFIKVYTLDFSEIVEKSKSIVADSNIKELFDPTVWRLVDPYLDQFARSIGSEKDDNVKINMMHFAKSHLGAWFFPNEDNEARETVIENILNNRIESDNFDNLFKSIG